jgi:hypothetical protein
VGSFGGYELQRGKGAESRGKIEMNQLIRVSRGATHPPGPTWLTHRSTNSASLSPWPVPGGPRRTLTREWAQHGVPGPAAPGVIEACQRLRQRRRRLLSKSDFVPGRFSLRAWASSECWQGDRQHAHDSQTTSPFPFHHDSSHNPEKDPVCAGQWAWPSCVGTSPTI